MLNDGISNRAVSFFVLGLYGSLLYGNNAFSRLPQLGVFLFIFCLCGAAVAIPALVFVSSVIGWVVFQLRKTKMNPKEAKSQATIAAVLAFVLLVLASYAIVAYWGRDWYIP